ncbi:MAG TPA: long-chain-fatty-acid--CoA ligase [Candidatus Hydrogenedentes bacterium]|nr:long-chain-fatty-acid--CoA ligase [Candidatus Hydrogenedentota bacterium]HOS01717.1 long-chain-fatty-acid--CoA ligase [Candidatus Hydrogenedentota bacterium]
MTITELFENRAIELGDKTFVRCEDETLSYREVHERAGRIAANLAASGVQKGDKIVLLMGNCVEFIYLFLGLGRLGAVVVPINPTLKPDEVAYIAGDSDAETLITASVFAPMLPEVRRQLPGLKRVYAIGEAVEGSAPFSALLEPTAAFPPIAAVRDDEAALIYTSGTTGLPKGVILTHGNYLANARMAVHGSGMDESDRFLCVLPLFHVNAQLSGVLCPLLLGTDVVVMKKFTPFQILPLIEAHRITILSAVPTIYNVMARMPKAAEYDISSIRFFVTGAAPITEETYNEVVRVLKKPLIMGYGLSEATCVSAIADYRDPIKWNSVGPPLRYTSIRIVGEDGHDVPYGSVGEIWTAGPHVMKGYYKQPQATAEVLKDGWLRTGDLGRFDQDGYLYIAGRVKDMIIRGGQNIYPQQVENVIARIPGVEECCVVGVEESRWGQEVLAVIKCVEGYSLVARQVIDYCRTHLAAYKCPQFVRFVDGLPKTATGKIKKGVVASLFADVAKNCP